jgi:Fur family peroxide stress response transcriptional regulator
MKRVELSERVEKMLAGVRAAGLKLTPQRMAIVKELASDETHPTAQEIFERLKPGLPTMSFATVYNTLGALSSAGLCAAMSLSPGSGRFDPNMAPHHHVVCDICGAVRDVPAGAPIAEGALESSAARAVAQVAPGFDVRSVERIFRGVCAACSRSRGRTRTS